MGAYAEYWRCLTSFSWNVSRVVPGNIEYVVSASVLQLPNELKSSSNLCCTGVGLGNRDDRNHEPCIRSLGRPFAG